MKNIRKSPKPKRKISKRVTAVYIVLRAFVIGVLLRQLIVGSYLNAALCVLTLLLFYIPDILDRTFNIKLPDALEVIILLFIFAAEILGEIREYYVEVPHWDTMLHTINGFLMAAIGFALVDILNQNEKIHVNLSPIFLAVVAFCFSMTIGVIWEFYEYTSDTVAKTDMQKDRWITEVSSVSIHPEGKNIPIRVKPKKIIFEDENGKSYTYENVYLDIGINDTMKDLLVNCLGAVIFSAIGLAYVKDRGKGKIAAAFIPVLNNDEEQ